MDRDVREAQRRRAWLEKLGPGVAFERSHDFGSERVHRYRLENGLTVLVLVDASAPIASYFTWFKVGSRHERPGKTGLAHLFEHLMFNETEKLKAGEFDRKLEENGAESNAGTWVDWTYYYESLPAARIGVAVDLESQRMAKLVLREPQVASEKDVVMNERRHRVEDDVDGAASEILYKTAFTRHPYHWPTIGWMKDIEGFTPDDCVSFYRTYYTPNNAVVVVVGDVREPDVVAKIAKAYGPIPRGDVPPEDIEAEPHQVETREVVMKKQAASERLLVAYKGPALGDADHATLSVLNEILFAGRAARVYRALILEQELATEVHGWVSTFRDPGLYEISVTARAGKSAGDIQRTLDAELARARADLVSDDELARAKARLELSMLQSLETIPGKAEQIGFYETTLGDPAAAFRRLEAFRRVTAADLRRVARRYLVDGGRTIVRVLPEAPTS